MEGANFLNWFKKLFLPAIAHISTSPGVVLFVDGHHSHLSLELIELAKEKCVHLICFPPHLTRILQPLDVSVYHPVKQSWAKVLKEHKLESMAETVTKVVFPSLIKKLWDCSFKTNHIVSGFRATGLHPLDPAPVLCKLRASMPFRVPSSAPSTSDTSIVVAKSKTTYFIICGYNCIVSSYCICIIATNIVHKWNCQARDPGCLPQLRCKTYSHASTLDSSL